MALFDRLAARLAAKHAAQEAAKLARQAEWDAEQEQNNARKQDMADQEQRQADFIRQTEERFPPSRFPRIPDTIREWVNDSSVLNFSEDLQLWGGLLAKYPMPPSNERERKAAGARFWHDQVNNFILPQTETDTELMIKQKVLDAFFINEKWLLREYFAATGSYVETYYGKNLIVVIESYREAKQAFNAMLDKDGTWSTTVASNRSKDQDLNKWENKFEELVKSRAPHMERWGNWYFSNIEQTFEAMTRTVDPRSVRRSDDI